MNATTRRLTMIGCLIVFVLPGIVLGSCRQEEQAEGKLNVVTSIFPMYDMARAVGGGDVTLSQLIPPGTEAHTFEPTPSDIIRLERADVFVYNGANMEPWIGMILSGVKNPNILVVDTSDGITLIRGKDKEGADPHIWLDVDNAKKQVDAIAAAFEKKDGAHSADYRRRAEDYKRQLDEVDKLYREALADCETNVIVSSGHFAFGYLAARYGLTYTSVYGLSPDAEPTPARIAAIIDLVRKEKTRYLFAEEMLDRRLTDSIRHETGAEILFVSSGHDISKDDFNRGITLIDIMKGNLKEFKQGLLCR
ncbi:MAG: zinc ABC transporter substrate-binding protein [Deltaproteobacteria bacterium]|nr:zinc ABC transporter substrate-binding protein [Candidatus Zymogenaceae bacterium]